MIAEVLGELTQGWHRQIVSIQKDRECCTGTVSSSSHMQAEPSLPMGWVNATVFSFAMYISGVGIEHSLRDVMTRISRTTHELATSQYENNFSAGGCTNQISFGTRILSQVSSR
jgi:hypothetical protein